MKWRWDCRATLFFCSTAMGMRGHATAAGKSKTSTPLFCQLSNWPCIRFQQVGWSKKRHMVPPIKENLNHILHHFSLVWAVGKFGLLTPEAQYSFKLDFLFLWVYITRLHKLNIKTPPWKTEQNFEACYSSDAKRIWQTEVTRTLPLFLRNLLNQSALFKSENPIFFIG